jgi:hypothetical protein
MGANSFLMPTVRMPYKLRKAPKKDLYWVVNKETGKKHSKEPLPKETAVAQMKALYASEPKVGGVSAKMKQDTLAKMREIPNSIELNKINPTVFERAVWWYLHPEAEDSRASRVKGVSDATAEWFLNSKEGEEVMPATVATKPVIITQKRRKQPKVYTNYEVNKLRVKSNKYENNPPDGVTYTEWQTDTEPHRLLMLDTYKRRNLYPSERTRPFYIQQKKVKIDGKTHNELNQIGTTVTFYGKEEFEEYIKNTPPSVMKGGMIGGASTPTKNVLQQMAVASYSSKPPQEIGSYKLIKESPTLKFYYDESKNLIIVAIRGTQITDKHDLIADALAVTGNLKNSYRYNNDLKQLREVKKLYPKALFFGVGHSLGGAILDLFLRNRLLIGGLSYNGFPEPQERQGNPLHHRIYHTGDFIYKMFAKDIPNIELRTTSEPYWKYLIKYSMPVDIFTGIDRHLLDRFKGGILL